MENQTPWKYAVVGSGAIGCYYGAKLARAGREVHFLMRGDLGTVRRDGLRIRSAQDGDILLEKVHAHATTPEIGPVDVVLIGLKTTANHALDALIPPLLKDGTMLMTLQNGLGNEALLAERFGAERVLGGLCFVCLNRVAPGIVEHYGHGTLSLGEFNRPPLPRTERLVAEFRDAGIDARVVQNLAAERWRKLVWNIPFNGLAIAAGHATTADILRDEGLNRLARNLMREVVGAAGRLCHEIPPAFIDDQFERSWKMGAYKPSSLLDHAAGREVEVEAIWGEPWRQAVAAGAKVPQLEMLYALLKNICPRGK